MTAKRKTKTKTKADTGDAKPLVIEAEKDESEAETMARVMLAPYLRHGVVAQGMTDKMLGKLPGEPRFDDYARVLKDKATAAKSGDLAIATEVLTAQALSLDAIFTEFARRAALNMGEYIHAAERYGRLALKAQSNCRATLEALAKLHQPREQTVRHVHVNEGGQAIVADEFHNHEGGEKIGKSSEQSHAPAIDGPAGTSPALPSPDPLGNGVPISSGQREAAMQDARRD